ncbi:hypothetical protein AVEN_117467-1 [Araneus ventricosus]|uniref:Uncharacterized protein n=1 Tax=Araneus ventricosus TaxID=182803 RepID=A0A4Y2HVA6_ARAVE|nr:hypothetical protein AVEN_117467-1 [Araneus ventricosus]
MSQERIASHRLVVESRLKFFQIFSKLQIPRNFWNTAILTLAQWFGLVILTSRFEATQGLFVDGPRNFETRSDDEDDAWAGTLLSKLLQLTSERAFGSLRMIWRATGPHTRWFFGRIGFRTWRARDLTTRSPRPRYC